MAVSDDLETAIVSRIDGLGLLLGTTAVVVERKKAPKIERGLETNPRIQVSASQRSGRSGWFETGWTDEPSGVKQWEYVVEITMNAAGNRTTEDGVADYRDWRERIGRAFEPPSVLGVTELFDVIIDPQNQYDREGFERNLDQSRMELICVTIEPAAN